MPRRSGIVKLPSGGVAIVCFQSKRPKCWYCPRPGDYQCDAQLGDRGTCDRYLCARHRIAIGKNRDVCPLHASHHPPPNNAPAPAA